MAQDIEIVQNQGAIKARQAQGLPELVSPPEESPLLKLNGPELPRASIRAMLSGSEPNIGRMDSPLEVSADALQVNIVIASEASKAKPGLLGQFIDKLRHDTIEVAEFIKALSEDHLPKWISNLVVSSVDFALELPTLFKSGIDYLNKKATACWDSVCEKCGEAKNWALEFFAPALEWATKIKDSVTEFVTGKSNKFERPLAPELVFPLADKGLTSGESKLANLVHTFAEPPDAKYLDDTKVSVKIFQLLEEFAQLLSKHHRDEKVHAEMETRQFEEKRRESIGNIAQAIASHPECADFIRARVQSAYAQAGIAFDDITDGELNAMVAAAHGSKKPAEIPVLAANITDLTRFTNARSTQAA